ncbi:Flp pilus assembly protein CpaB [Georgenia soli]|uniref:Flp pilus assembly protein CpaB n=1 Tax=Georgenia soli TaxID=638953 RepID=UPI00117B7D4D|nr:RcpC/CpaB family pilus assembly protein [Georgenia soli]
MVGTVLIVAYVGGADQRAMADLQPTQVLFVTQPVPEGTPAEDLAEYVALESVPASAVAPGAMAALDEIAGRVAETDLVPGEQLLAHRFVEPESLEADDEVEVPAGMHQLTVQLDRTRVIGGHLTAGDTVGVFVSFNDDESPQTHLMDHKVLVTRVQGGITPPVPADESESDTAQAAAAAPAESIMVTLALDAAAAEEIVYAAEYERIWLSIEAAEASETGTRIVTRENLYE